MNASTVFLFLFVQVYICRAEHISLQLVGGREAHEGNVLVKRGSEWGLVCDDEWDVEDGNVVCRQLGYSKAAQVTTYNKYFSSISEKIFLDDVKCQGHESNLGECMHREWLTSNCNAGEAAGVICAVDAAADPQLLMQNVQDLEPSATTSSLRIDIETDRSPEHSRVASAASQAAIDIDTHVAEQASTSTDSDVPVATSGYSERTRELLARVRALLNPVQPAAPAQPETPAPVQLPDESIGAALSDWDMSLTHAELDTDSSAALTGVSGYFTLDDSSSHSQQAMIVPREVTDDEMQKVEEEIDEMKMKSDQPLLPPARPYRVEVVGGRRSSEGYVRVTMDNGKAGAVCSDNWGIYEAMVVCRQTGKQQAEKATLVDYYGARNEDKVIYEINCDGHERSLADCEYKLADRHGAKCSKPMNVAGVVCTSAKLPDLMPNLWALQSSLRIEDKPLHSLTCAMEENCLSSSAHTASYGTNSFGYNSLFGGGYSSGPTRRLLRFSSNIFNNGTADFRPKQHRSGWEWHSCHQHYHSMGAFSHYDILDSHGNRVAEGHKASFCLEDVECNWPHTKKYSCRGFADQGISVGCADVYRSDIDCQWIDITDLKAGAYVFKLNVNPDLEVAELSFDNNAAVCELTYNGYSAKLTNCVHARG